MDSWAWKLNQGAEWIINNSWFGAPNPITSGLNIISNRNIPGVNESSLESGVNVLLSVAPFGKVPGMKNLIAKQLIKRFFKFGGDEAVIHFGKHSKGIMNAFGKTAYNLKNYMVDANFVIHAGTYIPQLNGYVKLIGGKGSAKYAFVGMDQLGERITTFHIKNIKELAKKAPDMFSH